MKITQLTLGFLLVFIQGLNIYAQDDDLDALLDAEMEDVVDYAQATFKTTRIMTLHSIERMPHKGLDFRVSHRFGEIREGFWELYGLDYSSSFFSLEYGLNDWAMAGIGRATHNKTWHAYFKPVLLRQSSGSRTMPVTVGWLSSIDLKAIKYTIPEQQENFSGRLAFTHQLMIARKFGPDLSLQINPTFVHRNMVEIPSQNNDLVALGFGGRYKITKRTSINFEYYPVFGLADGPNDKYYSPISVGVDIQAGSHVFQFFVTNSEGMTESIMLGETTGDFLKGDVRIGFNISQVFTTD